MKHFSKSLFSLALLASSAVHGQTIISDSFESGDLSARYTDGLRWGGTNNTSLVKRDPVMGDMIIYRSNRQEEVLMGWNREWQAKDGDVAMRFDFPAGANSWAEQRFSLDSAMPEIWISFWLKVPINFKHSSNSPGNNKLFALWMDDYSSKGAGPTVIWEFWNDGSGGSRLAYHYSPGGYKTANAHKQHTSFIRYPQDQGRWMQIVLHVKAAARPGSNDGLIRTYRRWENESKFSMLHEDLKADIGPPSSGPKGWKAGYLMGWSNPGYAEQTEFLLDDFKISRSSLLDAADSPSGPGSKPAPQPEPDPGTMPEQPPAECKPPRIPQILS